MNLEIPVHLFTLDPKNRVIIGYSLNYEDNLLIYSME